MKTKKKHIAAVAAIVCLGVAWLKLGIFQDREFSDYYLFTKHRPTLKVFFHAPIGESDKRLEDLSEAQRKEELAFVEFVYNGGGYERKIYIFSL